MDTYIKGNYRRTIFERENFIIGIFKILETNNEDLTSYINKTITITGYFDNINQDESYILYGNPLTHPKYGYQFQVEKYEQLLPQDKDGIITFLSSDLFPGIGFKIAKKIVDELGDNALEKILENKEVLYKIPKLKQSKIEIIYDNLYKNSKSHKIIIELNNLGFTNKESLDIYNRYKDDSLNIIEEDIYKTITDVNIPYKKVDTIFISKTNDYSNKNRIKATILYILKSIIYQTGDTYVMKDTLYNQLIKYLKIDINYEDFTKYSINENITIEEDMYYLKEMYQDIEYITYRIKRLVKQDIKKYKIDNYIESLENNLNIKYSESQKQAIINSITNNISIITGGPGTGKTTIVNAICEIYAMINKYNKSNMEDKVALLAPTGRASKRLKESTNLKASTIHRFLKWNKEDDKFQINANNISEVDLVIIDEASMIDIPLFASLLKGLSYKTNIIIVGDYNQLPSVGPGTLLKDLIDSNIINTTYLDLLYRQDVNSYINKLAIEVKDNKLSNFKEKKDDYLFIETNNIIPYLKQVCTKLVEKYNYREIQVMAPIYSSINGIDNINKELQNIFNPSDINKKELKIGDVIYRENDKILQLVNMPEENIYNGDIGTIKYIINKENSRSGSDEIHVMFDNNLVKYTTKDFIKIKHGYCISIHKSQGSEFKVVVLPICNSYKRMLYRKLIYTAITRAKNKLIVIGDSNSFIYGISNNNEYIRNSKLKEKLINMYN